MEEKREHCAGESDDDPIQPQSTERIREVDIRAVFTVIVVANLPPRRGNNEATGSDL